MKKSDIIKWIIEDVKIKSLQVEGSDGNGYYGTGYTIYVKLPKTKETEEI